MKNIIYSSIIVSLILTGSAVLLIYFTQDFNIDYDFKDSIRFSELEVQINYRGDAQYLGSAKAELGTIELENNGIFSQLFYLPKFVGCIDLKEGVSEQEAKIRNYQFRVFIMRDGKTYDYSDQIEIPKGKSQKFKLVGEYFSYDVPLDYYTSGNIAGISIYALPSDNENPFDDGSYYNLRTKTDCNSLNLSSTLRETIPVS